MKKVSLITAAAMAVSMMGMCSCSFGFLNSASIGTYDNADKYTAGDLDTDEKIKSVDIEWASGAVDVVTGGSGKVTVTETCKDDLPDEEKVHTWVNDGVLYVKFCASGEKVDSSSEKRVEITLPKGTELEKFSAEASSADMTIGGINAKSAYLEASSGDVSFDGDAGKFEAETSSGNIRFSGEADTISTEASSGEVFIDQSGDSKSISAETSSGEIEINADSTDKLSTESSSGDHTIKLGGMPADIGIEASSGDIELYLPEDSEFKATIETSSGDVSYELPLTKTGDESYTCGSANNELSIETSSGDVEIFKN